VTWRLRSSLFGGLFLVATAGFVLAGIAVSPFSGPATIAVVHGWTRFHAWLARHLVGIRSHLDGRIPVDPCLIAVKHQAMFETLEMVRLGHRPAVVMKKELGDLPLFGFMTRRYGSIHVERSAGAAALRTMMTEAKAAKATGRSVLIYPEGTRVRPGEEPPLRPGFAGLYRLLDLPVVPVALDSGRYWRGLRALRPGVIRIVVGDVIPAGLDRADVEARVHRAINVLDRPGPAVG
jgi:1-acyl-sn-glycerol-3-phosphate acyltransferase